jgi:hypothetical protein
MLVAEVGWEEVGLSAGGQPLEEALANIVLFSTPATCPCYSRNRSAGFLQWDALGVHSHVAT